MLGLYRQTTHEDRVNIDAEIERRTGVHCDYALEKKMVTKREFRRIVEEVLARKKREYGRVLTKMVEEKVVV